MLGHVPPSLGAHSPSHHQPHDGHIYNRACCIPFYIPAGNDGSWQLLLTSQDLQLDWSVTKLGDVVTSGVIGALLGFDVGSEDIGDSEGELVGSEDTGDCEGQFVGSEDTGDCEGELVGCKTN